MDILRPFRRCFKCRNQDHGSLDLERIHNGTLYSDHWHYYHESCLREVLSEPEKYTSSQVDTAIEIDDLLRRKEEQHQSSLESRRAQIETARERASVRFSREETSAADRYYRESRTAYIAALQAADIALSAKRQNPPVSSTLKMTQAIQDLISARSEPAAQPPNRYDLLKGKKNEN